MPMSASFASPGPLTAHPITATLRLSGISSTIFSTNNLKQFTMASAELVLNRNKSHLPKAKFYGKTLLSFHSGVAVSYLLWLSFGLHTSWLCLLPLAAAFALELSACRESNESPAL